MSTKKTIKKAHKKPTSRSSQSRYHKKKRLSYKHRIHITMVTTFVLFVTILCLIVHAIVPDQVQQSASNTEKITEKKKKVDKSTYPSVTVCIDPGHGGYDGGNIGADGTAEKEITIKYAKYFGQYLQEMNPNIKLVYTRDSDVVSWEEDEDSDLKARVKVADDANADYFISFHLNSSDVDLLINTLLKDPTQFAKDITVLIHRVLKDLGINVEQSELYNTLKNLIGAFVNVSLKNIDTFFTLINVDTIKTIALAHYPEICLSHLTNQDKNFTSNISTYNTDGSYYYLEVNGVNSSTNIEILDNNNNTVAKIENGNFIVTSNTLTSGTTISDTYYAYFPVEESYNLKISNAKSYSLTYFDQRYENLVDYKKSDNIGSNIIDIKTTTYPERG